VSAAFTPGPWKANIHETLADAREDSAFTWLHTEKDAAHFLPLGCVWVDIGRGVTGLPGHVETTAANARLIAASPTMYERLAVVAEVLSRLPETKTNEELWGAYTGGIAVLAQSVGK